MKSDLIIDGEAIVQARIRGESVRRIAKQFGCTIDDVNEVLDNFAATTISHKLRFHTLALELARLDELQQVFVDQARNGCVQSAMLVTKIIERRAIMLGLSAPPRQDQIPQVIEATAPPQKTSTERLREVMDRLCAEKPKTAAAPDDPKPDDPKLN